jgi:hypothetical protein
VPTSGGVVLATKWLFLDFKQAAVHVLLVGNSPAVDIYQAVVTSGSLPLYGSSVETIVVIE